MPESNVFRPLGLSLSEEQIPDLLETLVVRSDGRSCWSRVACAQGRRATRLRYAPTNVVLEFTALCDFVDAVQRWRVICCSYRSEASPPTILFSTEPAQHASGLRGEEADDRNAGCILPKMPDDDGFKRVSLDFEI